MLWYVMRGVSRLIQALLLASISLWTSTSIAAAEKLHTIERAQFLLSDQRSPPSRDAGWSEVGLPHDWRTLGERGRLTGWYRITIDLDAVPAVPQGIYLRHLRAYVVDLHINGARHVGSRDIYGPGAQDYGYALLALVPPASLKRGENTLHFRLVAGSYPRLLHGLGRVRIGPFVDIREAAARDTDLGSGTFRLSFAATSTAGLITLLLWLANRQDRVMFWFCFACLSWAAAGIPGLWLRHHTAQWILDLANAYVRVGMPIPVFIMVLRFVDLRLPRVELGLALLLLLQCTFFVYAPWLGELGGHWALRVVWPTVSALLLFAGIGIVVRFAKRPLGWSHYLKMAALATMGALLLQDLARYAGWVDLEPVIVRHYHVPVMVLAIGLVIFERHVAALWRVQRDKDELERRVAEAVREIESNQQRIAAAMHEQSLARERQRIMADIHDGLGASLVGLLRYVQARPQDHKGIEQRVREALQEMRIAIDALAPDQGDLATLLGSLRYRLAPLTEAVGVTLAWDVADMPEYRLCQPAPVFAIQRAVLEALFNALKHSGAKQIRLTAFSDVEGVEIRVEDDGKGFDVDAKRAGRGLGTMRDRVLGLGGRCEIRSRTGAGTTVKFRLPFVHGDNLTLAGAPSRASGDIAR